jgi:hypothetical protein
VTGGGALGGVVQGVLNTVTRGANARLRDAADTSPVTGPGGGSSSTTRAPKGTYIGNLDRVFPRHNLGQPGARLSPGQVVKIAQSAGLPGRAFEQIAHGESDYHPGIIGHDPGGTLGYGLFQNTTRVNGPAFEKVIQKLGGWAQQLNPYKNARAAKWLYDRGGTKHWFGTKFLKKAAGGRLGQAMRYFGGGGRSKGKGPSISTVGARSTPRTSDALQTSRVQAYDRIMGDNGLVAVDEKKYAQAERKYDQSDEVLVDPITGALNQEGIEKRVGELNALVKIRQRIEKRLNDALEIAKRVVETYKTIIARLTKAVKSAKGKDRRTKTKDKIAGYQVQLKKWEQNVQDVGFQVGDSQLDLGDLDNEIADVRGTRAQTPDPQTVDDTSSSTPDADAVIAQIQAVADNVKAQLTASSQVVATFSSSGDIGTGGSNAISAVGNEAHPVGAQYAPAGSLRSAVDAAPVVNNITNYNMPGAPHVLRAIGDAATAGQGMQASIPASVVRLGF